MADLNEISLAIGRLQASDESSQRQRAELFKQVGDLKDEMHKGFGALQAALTPLVGDIRTTRHDLINLKFGLTGEGGAIPRIGEHIKAHCDELKGINNMVQRGKGARWAIGILWTVVLAMAPTGLWLFNVYKADQDARLRRIEFQMPRSIVGPQ